MKFNKGAIVLAEDVCYAGGMRKGRDEYADPSDHPREKKGSGPDAGTGGGAAGGIDSSGE